MIKLTEIIKNPEHYDEKKGSVISTFSLRSLYVNPAHVVSLTTDPAYNESHERSPLIADLSPHARFTRLTLFSGAKHHTYHNILGSPSAVASVIRGVPEAT